MNRSNFINVATNSNDGSKIAWTDEELLEAIEVLQCLVAYFSTRKEYLIAHALRLELMSREAVLHWRRGVEAKAKGGTNVKLEKVK